MTMRGQGIRVVAPAGMWLAGIEFGSVASQERLFAARAWVEVWSEEGRLLTESVVNVLVGPWYPPIFSYGVYREVVLRASIEGVRARVRWRNQERSTEVDVAVPVVAEPPDDVTRDPVTGRLTIQRAGTYRISAPLVNAGPTWVGSPRDGQPVTAGEIVQMVEPLFTTTEHAAAWRKEYIDVLEAVLARLRRDLDACTRDGQRLSRLLAEEEATTEALEAALHALVDDDVTTAHFRENALVCAVCGASNETTEPLPHAPDCPVVRARARLNPSS